MFFVFPPAVTFKADSTLPSAIKHFQRRIRIYKCRAAAGDKHHQNDKASYFVYLFYFVFAVFAVLRPLGQEKRMKNEQTEPEAVLSYSER